MQARQFGFQNLDAAFGAPMDRDFTRLEIESLDLRHIGKLQ